MGAAELSFIVKAIDDASGTLKGVGGELDHMEGKASKLAGVLKGAFAVGAVAAVAGIGALGAVLGSSVKEAMAAEETHAQLLAVLKSTGGAAGRSAEQIEQLALGLSTTTRYEDDAIVGAESLLLTFTKISGDVFPKATALTLDLATAFKMDLKSAAMMVGKALNDPVKGLTAMGKAGVTFTQSQKDMIKAMVEAGDVAGAQRVIMAELETQVGGSARAAGETMAGQMDILKNTLGNVKEEIGGALIPILKDLVSWLGPRMVVGLQKFSTWFRVTLVDVQQFIGKVGKAKDIIGDMVADVQAGKKINWQDLMNLSGLFTNQVDIQRKFATIVTDIQTGLGQIKTAFDTGGIGAAAGVAWDMFTGAISKAADGIDWAKIKAQIWLGWNKASSEIKFTWASIDWTGVYAGVTEAAGAAWALYSQYFLDENKQAMLAWDIQAGIKSAFAMAAAELDKGTVIDNTALWASITKAIRGPTASNQDFVKQVLDYMFPDVYAAFQPVRDAFESIATSISHIKEALKSTGEAKTKFAEDFSAGITNPFAGIASVIDAITDAIGRAIDAYNRLKDLFGGGGLPSGTNVGGVNTGGGDSGGHTMQRTGGTGNRALIPAGAGTGMNVVININASGGNPRAVAAAANNGVLQAARSLGIA
jgi:hypothetical protein